VVKRDEEDVLYLDSILTADSPLRFGSLQRLGFGKLEKHFESQDLSR
jgi:hypothetical protein